MMFENIVCAVDGSRHAVRAAEVASELAAKIGAKLTFLTVAKPVKLTEDVKRYMATERLSGTPQYVLDELTEQILKEVNECARRCGVAKAVTEVKTGPPARTIVSFVENTGADLLVLGSRGLGDLEGIFLGSVSHKVTSMAKCTCMTVK